MLAFDLSPKQALCFESPANEILYGGSAGGGKSHLLRVLAIIYAMTIPGVIVYLFRRTYPDLWRNHMEGPTSFPVLLNELIDAGIVRWEGSHNLFRFDNGSTIQLAHCQHEDDRFSYQGAEIHVLLIDELTLMTDKIYRFLRSRVRLGALGEKLKKKHRKMLPKIINGSNPGNVGHAMAKAQFVDPSEDGLYHAWRAPKEEGGFVRQFIRSRMEDNPWLDEDYGLRLEGLGNPRLVKAMRDGDWNVLIEGGMFDDLWTDSMHVVPAFQIPSSWTVYKGFDWGFSAPFSCGWWAQSDGSQPHTNFKSNLHFPAGSVFRIGELYGWNGRPNEGCRWTTGQIAKGIKEMETDLGFHILQNVPKRNIVSGYADPSIWDASRGKSVADQLAAKGVFFEKAYNQPGSRVNGWQLIRDMLQNVNEGNGLPGLYVFENCPQFRRTVPTLPRDPIKTDDVDTNAEDHVGDETRYFLQRLGDSFAQRVRLKGF